MKVVSELQNCSYLHFSDIASELWSLHRIHEIWHPGYCRS